MRTSVFLRGSVALLAAILPLVLHAQFQNPTQDELKMTADPAAPGAAAVYLYYEEIDNDPVHYQSIYARIKVLTDKGKNLATVDIPYERSAYKITDVEGRTIHPDGSEYKLTTKPEDLMSLKIGDQEIARKVFTLPNVTAGSILEYRYQIHYDDNHLSSPLWQIQGNYYVHKAHYVFTPFESFMPHAGQGFASSTVVTNSKGQEDNTLVWWYNLPQGVSVKQSYRTYSVDVSDVPPEPDEEYMPPIQSVLYKVFFYYSVGDADDYWDNEAKSWSKDVDKFAEVSGTIKQAAAGIVSPGDGEQAKAEKLYKAVQALENTDYTRAKSASEMKALKIKAAKHAEDTWKEKSGSSDDIAMLYLAMARAAGLTAYAMRVVDRNHAIFDPGLRTNQFDDTLVLVGIGGKGVLLDPGEKMCTFGEVSWTHSEVGGMRQSGQGAGFGKTPGQLYTDNTLERSGDVTLDANGAMTGYFTFTMRGQRAMQWRQAALKDQPDDLKKGFDNWVQTMMPQGVEGHVDHFLGLDDPSVNLMAIVKAKGALGTALPKRLLLPGVFFESQGREPFVNEAQRLEPVDMHYAEAMTDNITYHLPAGYAVEGAPQGVKDLWQGHAEYILNSQSASGQITVNRVLARNFDLAKPDEYQDLRGFYQKVATADGSELVLTPEPGGKGN